MEVKEVQLEDIRHKHPLALEDLQAMFQNYQEDDDDFDDNELLAYQNSYFTCKICGLGIDWYHRYYYTCTESCVYSVHKYCAKISTTLHCPSHRHDLILKKGSNNWKCHGCLTDHHYGMCYHCATCNYEIDLHCATFSEQKKIYHPGHPHPLISVTNDLTLCKCFACGKKQEGLFYHCLTCFNFSIHVDCVSLPFKFLLQNQNVSHIHMLTLSYSSLDIPYGCKCRICEKDIIHDLWLYKCSKCRFYVHLDCATSIGEPFMSILLPGKMDTNFNIDDHPDLLNFPLLDESYNILPHQVLGGKNYKCFDQIRSENGSLMHSSHKHPLLLINTPDANNLNTQPTPLHNPIKRVKLLCNGCVRPITQVPFYKCEVQVEGCDFYLHEWCTRLPTELENHPAHPQHTLVLFQFPSSQKRPGTASTWFRCEVCDLKCNGFGYACLKCKYRIDVHCGFIPEKITHESHPGHLLLRVDASSVKSRSTAIVCRACHGNGYTSNFFFKCISCDFYLNDRCALHLPKTIRHKSDKHPLKLSYIPIENHKGEYFCEVCEDELNPEKWFYHCSECAQSIHSDCAPLILKSEQGISLFHKGVYEFVNMKFGAIIKRESHPHALSYVAGTESDGNCHNCNQRLQAHLIVKCLQCKYGVHGSCWSAFVELLESPKIEKPNIPVKLYYPRKVTRPVTK